MWQEYSITGGSIGLYTIPTNSPEADGTFSRDSTSMVLVQLECGSTRALGYTYADAGTATAARKLLDEIVLGSNPFCHAARLQKMPRQSRFESSLP